MVFLAESKGKTGPKRGPCLPQGSSKSFATRTIYLFSSCLETALYCAQVYKELEKKGKYVTLFSQVTFESFSMDCCSKELLCFATSPYEKYNKHEQFFRHRRHHTNQELLSLRKLSHSRQHHKFSPTFVVSSFNHHVYQHYCNEISHLRIFM